MNITIITNLRHLTYKHSNNLCRWLNKFFLRKINRKPELIKKLTNIPLLLIRKDKDYLDNDEYVDY